MTRSVLSQNYRTRRIAVLKHCLLPGIRFPSFPVVMVVPELERFPCGGKVRLGGPSRVAKRSGKVILQVSDSARDELEREWR